MLLFVINSYGPHQEEIHDKQAAGSRTIYIVFREDCLLSLVATESVDNMIALTIGELHSLALKQFPL